MPTRFVGRAFLRQSERFSSGSLIPTPNSPLNRGGTRLGTGPSVPDAYRWFRDGLTAARRSWSLWFNAFTKASFVGIPGLFRIA